MGSGGGERVGDPACAVGESDGLVDLVPETVWVQTAGGQSRPGFRYLDTPCDLQLIAAEWDHAHRHSVGKRLLR